MLRLDGLVNGSSIHFYADNNGAPGAEIPFPNTPAMATKLNPTLNHFVMVQVQALPEDLLFDQGAFYERDAQLFCDLFPGGLSTAPNPAQDVANGGPGAPTISWPALPFPQGNSLVDASFPQPLVGWDSQTLGTHACVVVTLYQDSSPGLGGCTDLANASDPTRFVNITDPAHCRSQRNCDADTTVAYSLVNLQLAANGSLSHVDTIISLVAMRVPLAWWEQPSVKREIEVLRQVGSDYPPYLLSALRNTLTPVDLKHELAPRGHGVRIAQEQERKGSRWLLRAEEGSVGGFDVISQIPRDVVEGEKIVLFASAFYQATKRTVEYTHIYHIEGR
jgi:hypothetical protein